MKTKKTISFLLIGCTVLILFSACSILLPEIDGSEIPIDIKVSATPPEIIELFPTSIPEAPETQVSEELTETIPTAVTTNINFQPDIPEWNIFLGKYEEADAAYQTAINTTDSSLEQVAEAYLGLGKLAYISGDDGVAIDYFDYVIEQFPTTEAAGTSYFYLGEIYTKLGDPDRAIRAYHFFQQSNAGKIDAFIWEKIGDSHLENDSFLDAVGAYQTTLSFITSIEPINQIKNKMATAYAGLEENDLAIQYFLDAYLNSENDYLKAEINLRLSWLYFDMNLPDKAYERLQINIDQFSFAYDSYTGLITLVEDDQLVNEYQRGLTDFYAGKYGVAIDAFNRYIQQTPISTRNGDVHHYNALAYIALEQYDLAILEWQQLISDFESSNYWTDAFDEIAYTQWIYLDVPKTAAETYLGFVETYYFMDEAPIFLYRAARMYERANELDLAAETWTRVAREYPAYELAFRAQQLTGVSYYRSEDWTSAQTAFEDLLQYATTPEDSAAAYFWLAKTYQNLESPSEENTAWEEAIRQAPGSYYSIRAEEIFEGSQLFETANSTPALIDLDRERESTLIWMQSEFLFADNFDQINRTKLELNEKTMQALTFWQLGLYSESYALLEELRTEYSEDAGMLFSLIDVMIDLGAYRSAAFASRQIIDLARADPTNLLTVPRYFNHIRYGTFYNDLITTTSEKYDFTPLVIFSQIRQESLYDSHVGSSAGAIGLMQIISPTGQHIADQLRDPEDYTTDDLYLPVVNVEYGTYYLDLQRDYFDGNLFLALAAYNAGPGNVGIWYQMANEDIDLFLEIIRFGETRDYIMNITETFQIYETLYQNPAN